MKRDDLIARALAVVADPISPAAMQPRCVWSRRRGPCNGLHATNR